MKGRDRVPFGPVQRKKEREKKVKNTRRMSNRFPIPSIRHIRNVECHARVIDGFWCRPMSAQRRKSRRTYFSRDRFIQFDLATRHPWQPRCSRHTSYCPPLHRHLILFYPSRISLSLFFSLRAPPGLLPPPSRNGRSNLLAVRNRLISLATGTGGTRDTSWQRQSRLSRISCAEKRAASSSACILSGLLQLCSTVGRIGRVRMWRVMQWKGGRRERSFNFARHEGESL